MQEKLERYAKVLLNNCLKVDKEKPLFISFNIERIDFARIVVKEATKIGLKDIYLDIVDPYIKHDLLKKLEIEDLKKLPYWNKSNWNEYAKKEAAFLMLASENPHLNEDLDPKKQQIMATYSQETRKEFNDLRDKHRVSWCIAAVPTESWAKEIFKDEKDPINKLWEVILDICGINEENPENLWNNKIKNLQERAAKLNSYKFKKLIYKNKKGTDFTVELPENHIWASGEDTLYNNKKVLVNFPTEEIFTSPDYKSANGRVYSSKPLNYQDIVVDEFYIDFKDGEAIDCHAKTGEETLRELIKSCKNCCYLGEVALVPFDSPISNSNIIFKETLFDENASCHLALGAGFTECIKNGEQMSKEELQENKINVCDNHVDFMIGTKDLHIIGITENGTEVPIFKEGNFSSYFE